jgi:hypothetical protein
VQIEEERGKTCRLLQVQKKEDRRKTDSFRYRQKWREERQIIPIQTDEERRKTDSFW